VSLAPAVFRDQLAVVADGGGRGIAVSQYAEARRAGQLLPGGTFVLTFDDAYADFAGEVFPVLEQYGWRATVFVPILPVDGDRPWDCGDGYPRRLMTWPTIGALASRGVEFAAHSLSHADLTRLGADEARRDIVESGRRLAAHTGRPAAGFAAPGGRTTPALRAEVAVHYDWCAGTRLDRAGADVDLYDLPRIEMWYFRNLRRWRQYVADGWTPYFALRQGLRAVRTCWPS
jgi:peptidoglycan/xylan/chitin deacetylase (PgdA/CDA1 family)